MCHETWNYLFQLFKLIVWLNFSPLFLHMCNFCYIFFIDKNFWNKNGFAKPVIEFNTWSRYLVCQGQAHNQVYRSAWFYICCYHPLYTHKQWHLCTLMLRQEDLSVWDSCGFCFNLLHFLSHLSQANAKCNPRLP